MTSEDTYRKWWIGKKARVHHSRPFKTVVDLEFIGVPSGVRGDVLLKFDDGSSDFVPDKGSYKPRKSDVQIVVDEPPGDNPFALTWLGRRVSVFKKGGFAVDGLDLGSRQTNNIAYQKGDLILFYVRGRTVWVTPDKQVYFNSIYRLARVSKIDENDYFTVYSIDEELETMTSAQDNWREVRAYLIGVANEQAG